VPFVRNLGEVAGELKAHTFTRTDPALASLFEAVEKIADGNPEHLGHFKQAPSGDTVDATLVFVRLLVGDANQIGKLLLRQTEHNTSLANARPDMAIDILGSARRSTGRYNGARRRVRLRVAARSGSLGSVCHDDLLLVLRSAPLACRSSDLTLHEERAAFGKLFSLDLAALFNQLVSAD
jgi:hypothetical protein